MTLYSYWRSSTSYRVRIALNLKGIAHRVVPLDLGQGAQRRAEYLTLNPSGGVPTLVLGGGDVLTQSMAILEYLDRIAPEPPLLPTDPVQRARVQAAAQVVATDIHPVNNLKVVARLRSFHGLTEEEGIGWMRHWMTEGLRAYQALLPDGPAFSFADAPQLCDICLIPQLYNAHRWGVDMAPFARLLRIEERALDLTAFAAARPESQPDAA